MTENHDPAPPSIGDSQTPETTGDLISILSRKVVGQSSATSAIVPYVYVYQPGLAPEGRPAGVFLLLGPTDTGKTKTVEAMAELLPGSEKKIVKIDCGGDNSTVDFEKSLTFFTNNLDRREMLKEMNPDIGFQRATPRPRAELKTKTKNMPVCSRSRIGQHGPVTHSS